MKKNDPITPLNLPDLKPGDRLRVVEPCESEGLKKDMIVEFERFYTDDDIYVSSPRQLSYRMSRFVFEAPANAPLRGPGGRFVSRQPAKARQKPFMLKKGAIYAVKRRRGVQLANLRNIAYGDVVVFSKHGKPFLAKRDQVFIADNDEVGNYLSESRKS